MRSTLNAFCSAFLKRYIIVVVHRASIKCPNYLVLNESAVAWHTCDGAGMRVAADPVDPPTDGASGTERDPGGGGVPAAASLRPAPGPGALTGARACAGVTLDPVLATGPG